MRHLRVRPGITCTSGSPDAGALRRCKCSRCLWASLCFAPCIASRIRRPNAQLIPERTLSFILIACLGGGALAAFADEHAAEPAYRYSAPLTVQASGAFVQVPLPASTYGHSQRPGLADLRVLDARGERVPHALLPAPAPRVQRQEQAASAALYALPRRVSPGAALASPLEVRVQGDHISVRRLGGNTAVATDTPGWLVDLGERKPEIPKPQSLRLSWAGAAEFSAAFDLDTSDTLREWRRAGSGQVLALASASGPLVQRDVPLPDGGARFVRLVWRDAANAPRLSGVSAVTAQQTEEAQEPPVEWRVSPSPEPKGAAAVPAGALHFDLGGALPVATLQLLLPPGTRVAPVRLQGRGRATEAWQDLGSAVFYRLQRDEQQSLSPPLPLHATLRYLRVLPDPRSAPLDPALTTLQVQANLPRLVFATQGTPPYTLQVGAAEATAGALPLATLVPQFDEEQKRFGRAELGAFTEQAEVALRAEAQRRRAALRPWLLWAVLLAGVAGLGFMVWTLARGRGGPAAS